MPRKPRASLGGYGYPVLNRGNGRHTIVHKDGDYAAFIKRLRWAHGRPQKKTEEQLTLFGHRTNAD